MKLLPLIAATYFMVSGGPYGLEDIIGKAGYGRALLLLLFIPLIWSLPTSLMVGELASALPEEGGYYCWVRRALGTFWGFQEAWLSLAASVFDMAIYPVLFVLYLGRIEPLWTAGYRGTLWALAVVLLCALWNLRGAAVVGEGSVALFVLLLSPFIVLVVVSVYKSLSHAHLGIASMAAPTTGYDLAGAISVALWNYMGWDNASTVAQEVEHPQRNYPRAMLIAAALVAVTYIVPLLAVALAGIPAAQFSTGAWTDAAHQIAGPALALAVVLGGTINGFGMFNALMLSYTRIPYALAREGLLPKVVALKSAQGVPGSASCSAPSPGRSRSTSPLSASSPSTSSSTEPPCSWSSSPSSSYAFASLASTAPSASPAEQPEPSPLESDPRSSFCSPSTPPEQNE